MRGSFTLRDCAFLAGTQGASLVYSPRTTEAGNPRTTESGGIRVTEASASIGGDTDPHFANVSLLCGFDGSAIDESPNNFAITLVGNAAISAVDPIQGTGSLSLDGTGDWASVPANAAFDFGSGDFTIEAWVSFNTVDETFGDVIVSKWSNSGNSFSSWFFMRNSAGVLRFDFITSAYQYRGLTGPSFPVTLGDNYYVAISRSGSTFTFSINGSTTTVTNSESINYESSFPVIIGDLGVLGNRDIDGKLDEIRITKGVARDISVVPSGKFPRS